MLTLGTSSATAWGGCWGGREPEAAEALGPRGAPGGTGVQGAVLPKDPLSLATVGLEIGHRGPGQGNHL